MKLRDPTEPEVKHDTQHLIENKPAQPVENKPPCLTPDRFKNAKKNFDDMVQFGTARLLALGHRHFIWHPKKTAIGALARTTAPSALLLFQIDTLCHTYKISPRH